MVGRCAATYDVIPDNRNDDEMMDAATIRDRFNEEQEYLQKYIEFLRYKTAVYETEVQQIANIFSKYGLGALEKNGPWSLRNKAYTLNELQSLYILMQNSSEIIAAAIRETEKELNTLPEPDGLDTIDISSFQGELIQFMLDALQQDSSSEHIKTVRRDAIEQIKQLNAETGSDETVNDSMIDYAIRSAILLLEVKKLNDLKYVVSKAGEIEIALRMLKPEAEINVLRQGFILLMTVFDATIFDLMRVALRKEFFKLIGVFGKQEKVALESLNRYASFEKFRDEVIEEQLKAKYLKDILSILEHQHVQCVDETTGYKLIHLKEMVQRRNVHIHNRGRVDEKYLERDSNGTPRYNIYNLSPGAMAHIDLQYWELANLLCRNCIVSVVNWVDSL